ncbi:MAG: hypothetical protein ACE15B_18485 [Bryobacteraceae bacterium]
MKPVPPRHVQDPLRRKLQTRALTVAAGQRLERKKRQVPPAGRPRTG